MIINNGGALTREFTCEEKIYHLKLDTLYVSLILDSVLT